MLEPYEEISDDQQKTGLNYLIKDGITSQVMVSLTTGAFLIAFALGLGASNLIIGLLAAIGPLAQLLQLPSIFLVEKVRNRRLIVFVSAAINRLSWVLIILIPFLFFGKNVGITVLITVFIISSCLAAVSGCSWNSWMSDFVPKRMLGSFFSKRMRVSLGFGIVLSFVASIFLDYWKSSFPALELQGYSILFAVGMCSGFLGLYFISKIPEPKMISDGKSKGIFKIMSGPFRDENFRNLIKFLASWNFAVNLAAPFFVVYMLVRLEFSMSLVMGLIILSQIMNLLFLNIWGNFADRFSNKSVLAVSGPLFLFSILAWTFTTLPDKYFLTVPLVILIHIFMGIASAGITLASGNISLKLAPKGQATAYLATNTVVNSVAAGIAPILGGIFADFFKGKELAWTLTYSTPNKLFSLPTLNLQQWDFFFVVAFVLGLYSLHRLAAVREFGEVDEKIVFKELISRVKTQTRDFSSIDSMKGMVGFPFTFVSGLIKPKNKQVNANNVNVKLIKKNQIKK